MKRFNLTQLRYQLRFQLRQYRHYRRSRHQLLSLDERLLAVYRQPVGCLSRVRRIKHQHYAGTGQ